MADHNFMKRMAPFLVLEILKAHTDEEHGLKLTGIVALLEQDYGIVMDRKAVSRMLNDLLELSEIPGEYNWKNPMRFSIKCDETKRSTGNIRDNWRLCREFEDAEIQLLTDMLLSVRNYSGDRLLKKLHRLGSPSLRCSSRPGRINARPGGPRLPVNLYTLRRAICEKKQLTFHYAEKGTDKQWHVRTLDDGIPAQYIVSPYQIAFRHGIPYLLCGENGQLVSYPIDRIRDARVTEKPAVSYGALDGAGGWELDLQQYLDQHIYMCNGRSVTATFRIPEEMVSDVLDLFGEHVDMIGTHDDEVTVRAEVNHAAMVRFAKTFAPEVKVLSPAQLVTDVKEALQNALKAYD